MDNVQEVFAEPGDRDKEDHDGVSGAVHSDDVAGPAADERATRWIAVLNQ